MKNFYILLGLVLVASISFAADKKISDLPAAGALTGSEVVPVVQSSATKKATLDQVTAYANSKVTSISSPTGTFSVTIDAQNSQNGLMSCSSGTCTTPYTVVTTLGSSGTNSNVPTEKAVRDALGAAGSTSFTPLVSATTTTITGPINFIIASNVTNTFNTQNGTDLFSIVSGATVATFPANVRLITTTAGILQFVSYATPTHYAFTTATFAQGGTGGGGNNPVDASRGFEVNSDPSGWTKTDTASLLNIYDTAQAYQLTHSLSCLGTNTTAAYEQYDTGATRSPMTSAFWFYAPSSSSGDDLVTLWEFGAASIGTWSMQVSYQKSSGAYHLAARGNGSTTAGSTSITPAAWYRIEISYTQSASSTAKIYDSSGTLLDTVTITADINNCRYVYFGKPINNATTGWTSFYLDAIGLDWTNHVTPLWPFTVGN